MSNSLHSSHVDSKAIVVKREKRRNPLALLQQAQSTRTAHATTQHAQRPALLNAQVGTSRARKLLNAAQNQIFEDKNTDLLKKALESDAVVSFFFWRICQTNSKNLL